MTTMNRTPVWLLRQLLPLLVLLAGTSTLPAQYNANLDESTAQEAIWVDSVFNAMSPNERIGQLFMVRAYSNQGSGHVAAIERMIRDYHIGGMCFFQGTPEEQVRLINRYQSLSRHVPIMMAIDAEWGLGMRMSASTVSYPRQLMLGAVRDNQLLYDMGEEVARQLRRIGIHVNFAPVADVNNNPLNPVIGTRSFGEDRFNVTVKSYNYMQGMQDHGIMACAKHFPGHGDTEVDSHADLPVVPHDWERLDSIELYPFRTLVDKGIGSVMVAHLHVPTLDDRPNRPTTLSHSAVNRLLRMDMGFKGLTFTDALDMQGVAKYHEPGAVAAEAILAGNDVLVLPLDLGRARATIEEYVNGGRLSQEEVDRRVKRILRAKYRLGMQRFEPISTDNLREDLNSSQAVALKEELTAHSLTLVRNEGNLVPIREVADRQIAALAIGASARPEFQKMLANYSSIDLLRTGSSLSTSEQQELLRRLADEEVVIVSLHDMGGSARNNFGLNRSVLDFLQALNNQNEVILTVFGNPYSLRNFDQLGVVLEAYDEDPMTQRAAAQGIFGAIAIDGRLPITASERSPFNAGVTTSRIYRMGYAIPERVGLNSDTLQRYADEIAREAIESGATPGCVVLVARRGQVIFHEAYGHHTYSRQRRVQRDDIYDLASITKIASTTLAIMDLHDRGLVNLDKTLGDYIPDLRSTNKDALSIREILAHRAGLKPWIPFYRNTLAGNNSQLSDEYYRSQESGLYNVQVTDNLFLHQAYMDSIWNQIALSDLRSNKGYRYSDLGFYLLADLVEEITGQRIDAYVSERFYEPMGLQNIGYRPHEQFSIERIPPTELDRYWRGEKVQGYVHDMGAAMLGGVSGHAGLFGNAQDLAVVMQMLLQHGTYGGRQYLSPSTVEEFTSRYPGATRRGLGFDMKQLNSGLSQNVSYLASSRTFGHLGFTGTCVWADPEDELVFVFLSNRTFPSMRNNKLARLDIRPRMQSVAYEAIEERNVSPPVQPVAVRSTPDAVESITGQDQ